MAEETKKILRESVKELHVRCNELGEKINVSEKALMAALSKENQAMYEKLNTLGNRTERNTVAIENVAGMVEKQEAVNSVQMLTLGSINESLAELKVVASGGKKIAMWVLGIMGTIIAAVVLVVIGFGG